MWMEIFGKCTLFPESNPLILCPEYRLKKATTLLELTNIVREKSRGQVKDLVEGEPKMAQKLHDQIQTQKDADVGAGAKSWIGIQCHFGIEAMRKRPRTRCLAISISVASE